MKRTNLVVLTECSIMVALAFALSYARVYEMPLGGSVTLASMLPIMLVSLKHGSNVGLGAGFAYSLTQLFQALLAGNVFPYCETGTTLALCVLFDYIIPFTLLGLANVFNGTKLFKNNEISFYAGTAIVVFIRFICHFITGVAIWGQWAPNGMGKYLYSFLYNGSFLGADFVICIIVAILILRNREVRHLVGIGNVKSK